MTDAVMFDPQGRNILPAAILYKRIFLRSFRPVTKVNMDMYEKLKMFLDENKVERDASCFEITLSNLRSMVKLTNVISWTEQNCCVRWDNNDFKFPGILQGR
jgi:hypothetical protein